MTKRHVLLIALLAATASTAEAQRRCTKGIPCGNTCIAAGKTCRVGSPSTPAKPTTTTTPPKATAVPLVTPPPAAAATPAPHSANDTLFVGSRVDGVYFLRTCIAAQDLAEENRRYFKTEEDAIAAKYRRSRVPGC